MRINFAKYEGAGNDFILIDNLDGQFDSQNLELIKKLCDRRFGIGSDGLIAIEKDESTDFRMNFFNPDASQSFCGNGSRCAVAFYTTLRNTASELNFSAIDGEHNAEIKPAGFSIKMKDVDRVIQHEKKSFADTGSPHLMFYVTDVNRVDVVGEGKKIRYADEYKKEGVNVNFIQVVGKDHIKVRTYERGVENETFACGTGATACALSYLNKGNDGDFLVRVDVKGGTLRIHASKTGNRFHNIWLEGPANKVYEGYIDV